MPAVSVSRRESSFSRDLRVDSEPRDSRSNDVFAFSDQSERMFDTEQPLKMKLGSEDAYKMLKRGSIQMDDGRLGRVRKLSSARQTSNYVADSDSALSGFEPRLSSDGFGKRRLSSVSSSQRRSREMRNRGERRRRRQSASAVAVPSNKYEMTSRTVKRQYVNNAYESDSYV